MKKDDLVYVRHILDAIGDAEEFVKGMDYAKFDSDKMTKYAVVRSIEIMGEAAKGLSPEFRKKHADIPWSDIARMRDKAIHDYLGVNYEIVWRAAARFAGTEEET